jgi:hypothetical protein
MEKPAHNVLYVLPEPSTSFLREPVLEYVPGAFQKSPSMLTLSCTMRNKGQPIVEVLEFVEPLANAVHSLFTVPDFASIAYDKVVELQDSRWLAELRARIQSRPTKMDVSELRHLAVMFDDGPYYDFICRNFRHVQKTADPLGKRR